MIETHWSVWCFMVFVVFLIGFLVAFFLKFKAKQHKTEESVEEILEIFNEHGSCHHDYEGPSESYPGHDDVEFEIDDRGEEKIRKILEEL